PQVTNDAGEIDAAAAALDEALVDGGGAGAKRRGRAGHAGGSLRELQILEHHGRGEARLIVAIGRRGRYWARDRAIARHRPALPRRLRGNVEQLLRIEPEFFRQ